jgi:hypothetical protein
VNVNADVQNQLDAKPSMTYVNGQVSILEDEIADKIDISEYNDGMASVYDDLAEKVDASSYNTDQAAMTTLVNSKAATTYVDTQDASLLSNINTRATTTQLTDGLALKTDKSLFDSTVASLNTSIATKAATSYVDTQDTSLLSNINTRATVTQLTDGLALKANDSEVVKLTSTQTIGGQKIFSLLPQSNATPTAASDLVTKSWVEANYTPNGTSANYATKTYVDTQDALAPKLASNNTYTGSNTFTSLSTTGSTSLNNSVLQVNTGSILASKNIRVFGQALIFDESSTSSSGVTLISRDNVTRNVIIDSQSGGSATGGGVLFRLKNPTSLVQSDVLNVQADGVTSAVNITSASVPTTGSHLTNKTYVDTASTNLQNQINGCVKLASANAITATCSFSNTVTITGNVVAGTQTVTPTQLGYVSGATQNLQQQINATVKTSTDQSITGVKTFSSLPVCTSTVAPSSDNQLTRKKYVDDIGNLKANLAFTNAFSATNTFWGDTVFNTLPTSTITPTLPNQLTRKGYVDTQLSDGLALKANTADAALKASSNAFTGATNSFVGLSTSGVTTLNNGALTVNPGTIFANRAIRYQGQVALFDESTSSSSGLSAIYREASTKNLIFDSSYFNNSTGGGAVFRLKDPSAGTQADVLSVQPTSISANVPISCPAPTSSSHATNKTYVDSGLALKTDLTTFNTAISGCAKTSTANTFTAKQTFSANIDVDSEVVFTSTTAAGAVKGSASKPLVVTSMASQDLYLNPDKGSQTISSVNINSNHGAGQCNIYGNSLNVACSSANFGTTPINTSANIISSAGVSCSAVTAGNAYAGDTYTNGLRANNFGKVQCHSPLYGDLFYSVNQGIHGWIVNMNGIQSRITPVFCSQRAMIDNDFDSFYIIAPYTQIQSRENGDYGGTAYTMINDTPNWAKHVPTFNGTSGARKVSSLVVARRPFPGATTWVDIEFDTIS